MTAGSAGALTMLRPGGARSATCPGQTVGKKSFLLMLMGVLPAFRYGVTWATNVPQLANGVRGPPEMYSPANQMVPPGSATAAE